MKPETREKLQELLKKLGKRPAVVLKTLLAKGSISTFELGELGYDQPPRAAQDLKEHGVLLRSTDDKHPNTGNRMRVYWLADEQPMLEGKFAGRSALPKKFRNAVIEEYKSNCLFCGGVLEPARLQIDHRVPYQIAGEVNTQNTAEFMPLCASHQRTKSWACEHCSNYSVKDEAVCKSCFWAVPDRGYTHVCTRPERRVDLLWKNSDEVMTFEILNEKAKLKQLSLPEFIKAVLTKVASGQ